MIEELIARMAALLAQLQAAQLEELSAAKVATLQAPGQVLLKLAATGFAGRRLCCRRGGCRMWPRLLRGSRTG